MRRFLPILKITPREIASTQRIALISQLTALVVILQASTLYLPFLGDFVSHFATLLVAMAANLDTRNGFLATLGASFLLLFCAPKQIPILLFFDGPLGIWIGWGLSNNAQRRPLAWPLASTTMVLGLFFLTRLLGIPLLNGLAQSSSTIIVLFLTIAFSFTYVWAWFFFAQQIFAALDRRFTKI